MDPTQTGALVRRFWITQGRNKFRALVRFLLWPGLVLAALFYSIKRVQTPDDRKSMCEIIPIMLLLTTFYIFYYLLELLIHDKETKFRSLMLSMGLKRSSYMSAYTICSLSVLLPIATLLSIATIQCAQDTQTTKTAFVLVFLLYCVHASAFVQTVASGITSTKLAALYILTVALEFVLQSYLARWTKDLDESQRKLVVFAASASPALNIRLLIDSYLVCANCDKSLVEGDRVAQPLGWILSAMLFWILVLHLFSRWFERVCPWKNDEAIESPLFWLQRGRQRARKTIGQIDQPDSKYFEPSPKGLDIGIQVNKVSKIYNNLVAVDKVSFNIYRGETTLLLGHNGAGKTTLMNLILDKIKPDAGSIGIDQSSGSAIGICPQTSLLDEALTVRQHLELFHDIKASGSVSSPGRLRNVAKTLDDVMLRAQADKVPSELSGGMKRKLSLGIAFVADSSVLVLDEPSSGLDPDSRLSMWNSIRAQRHKRTVLLSTQHMEEADYLGDRIAIMSDGKIVCCGSSMFLSKLFGSSYKLRLECKVASRDQALQLVRNYFPAARVADDEQFRRPVEPGQKQYDDFVVELDWRATGAPTDTDADLALIKLLEDIEANSDALGIRSHGLKSASIEDVMLNTGKEFSNKKRDDDVEISLTKAHIEMIANSPRAEPAFAQLSLLGALIVKIAHIYRRDWKFVALFKIIATLWASYHTARHFESPSNYQLVGDFVDSSRLLFIAHLIKFPAVEAATKFKIMQMTTRLNFVTYWLAYLITDMVYAALATGAFIFWVQRRTAAEFFVAPKYQTNSIIAVSSTLFVVAGATLAYVLSCFVSDPKKAMGYHILFYLSSAFARVLTLFAFVDFRAQLYTTSGRSTPLSATPSTTLLSRTSL